MSIPSEGDYAAEQRSLRELLGRLSNDASELFRQELALMKTEIDAKLQRAKKDAGNVALGGAVLATGGLTLVAALVLLLSLAMPAWVAALLVGGVLSGAGAWLVRRATRDIQNVELRPEQSLNSLRLDVRTMKEAMR